MKVKHLIEDLQKLNPEAIVYISTLASENGLHIEEVKADGNWVELRADDILFKLDENGLAIIENMQDEEARFNAENSEIDIAMGK